MNVYEIRVTEDYRYSVQAKDEKEALQKYLNNHEGCTPLNQDRINITIDKLFHRSLLNQEILKDILSVENN